MLDRLFCFSGGGTRDADWGQSTYLASASRARVLEVVEEELEERWAALGRPAGRASQDAPYLRRLHQANLPPAELHLCKDLLRKLAAIDASREAAEGERQQMQAQVRAAEGAHRQAEFARARAEAIATARGEALMHAQLATREAEEQSLQLADMLTTALQQLGIEITPAKQPAAAVSPMLTPPPASAHGVTPLPRQSIFSQQQLAAVAASLSKLPRQSQAGLPYQQQQWRAAEAAQALEAEQHLQRASLEQQEIEQQHQRERQERRRGGSRRESRHASRERELEAAPAAAAAGGLRGSLDQGPQLSGFTVYTNGLQSPEFAEADGEVAQRPLPPPQQQRRQRRSSEAAAPAEPAVDERDSAGSGVQWRSISSAALSSRSQGQEHEQQLQQLQGGHPTKLRQHARHLSQLMLPALDASQLDSLVRIGASQASPDPHPPMSPVEVLQQLLPPGWQEAVQWEGGAVNPLQSNAEAERFLLELRAEMGRQQAASHDGTLGSMHEQQEQWQAAVDATAAGGRGGRAGSEPPGRLDLHQLYAEGRVPGAGTWVSPSLAAMIAHKKGFNPLLHSAEGGPQPSPPSHIKAVFGTTEDKEFYGPMAAHLNRRGEPEVAQRAPPRHAAAPAARPPLHSGSADSVRGGPQRQPPSNCSSIDGAGHRSVEWERQQQQQGALAPQRTQGVVQQRAGTAASSLDSSDQQQHQLEQQQHQLEQQQQPERRQAALRNRFQPMGVHASAAAQQEPQPAALRAPRRSSVAVSHLGGGSLRSSISGDENLAGAAMGKASVRGSSMPPPQRQQQGGAELPVSMRVSVGGKAASNIDASMHAVEAAMAALRGANPHLRESNYPAGPPPQQQQQQQYARASDGGVVGGRPGLPRSSQQQQQQRQAGSKSLPDAALDMSLHTLSGEDQRRSRELARQQAGQQQAAAAGYRY